MLDTKNMINPAHFCLRKGSRLFRLATSDLAHQLFNPVGPKGRFDHHLPPKAMEAAFQPQFGVCYVGQCLKSCLAEFVNAQYGLDCFRLRGNLHNYIVLELETAKDITLIDLFHDGLKRISAPPEILHENQDRFSSQTWARRFYSLPSELGPFGGIRWPSPKDGRASIVLNERVRDHINVVSRRPLSEITWDGELEKNCLASAIALEHGQWRLRRPTCPGLLRKLLILSTQFKKASDKGAAKRNSMISSARRPLAAAGDFQHI